jgi:hypothetical protein
MFETMRDHILTLWKFVALTRCVWLRRALCAEELCSLRWHHFLARSKPAFTQNVQYMSKLGTCLQEQSHDRIAVDM